MLDVISAGFGAAWLVVVYLFGFKIFRWMTTLVTALVTGAVAFVVVGLVVFSQSKADVEQALQEGIAIALVVSLLVAAGGFALAHFFQHVAAAFVGAVTFGGLSYVLGRLLMAQVTQDMPGREAEALSMTIAVVMALVVAAVVIVVAILYYDYFGAVWMVIGTSVSWTLSHLSYSVGRTGQSLWRSILGGDPVLKMVENVLGDIGGFVASTVMTWLLGAVAVIGLRALCWDSPTSLQVVRLRPELRPAILATALLLFWDLFWSRLLPVACGVLWAGIYLWPLTLVAFAWYLLPLGERRPGQKSGRVGLPASALWIKYVVALGVGLPLCSALVTFVVMDLPRIALARPGGIAVATLGQYYKAFFVVPGVLQGGGGSILTLAIKWFSIGLLGPVVLDWARRATPAGAVWALAATDATRGAGTEAPSTSPMGVAGVAAPAAAETRADVVALPGTVAAPAGAAATWPQWLLGLRRRWEQPSERRRLLGAAAAVAVGIIAVVVILFLRAGSARVAGGIATPATVNGIDMTRANAGPAAPDVGAASDRVANAAGLEEPRPPVATVHGAGSSRIALPPIPTEDSRPPTVAEWRTAAKLSAQTGSVPSRCFLKVVRCWLKFQCEGRIEGLTGESSLGPTGSVYLAQDSEKYVDVVLRVRQGIDGSMSFRRDEEPVSLVVRWLSGTEQPEVLVTGGSDTDARPEPVPAGGTRLAPEDVGFIDRAGGRGWGDRCYLHIGAGHYDYARAACQAGLDMNPPDPWVRGALLYNMGLIAEKEGRLEDARSWYRRSLEIRPTGVGVPTVRTALGRVGG